ncbi:hypothetical protein EDD76_105220 [Kineothrix alysoides]|uniref:Uncharacterized protein n=1 Tax=Kineothrix alysoides TaxID=1469948 RepID=A0A4R1R159_9FIRM|nr:hypothetical protein [Kineothrix alysoides]TCL59044.1 hypothetical protein EDD76_105220 [Kineothrix alysoides]
MLWPISKPADGIHYVSAWIVRITSDEAEGELIVRVLFDDKKEKEIIYEEMYYSQFDHRSEGIILTLIEEIGLRELRKPRYEAAAARLYEDCDADDVFLENMYRRGNRLYVHHTESSGEYIVLAKHMTIRNPDDDK